MLVVPAARPVGGHISLCCCCSLSLLRHCLPQNPSVQVTERKRCSSLCVSAASTTVFTPPSLSSSFVQETLDDLGQENDLQSEPAAVLS